MKTAPRILLLTLAISGWAVADLPVKAPLSKYTGLWTNSPFTSKPPVVGQETIANPLDDFALLGVSPISGGYRVTLINKKEPDKRTYVFSGEANPKHGFKILAVTRKSGDPHGTVVRMMAGSLTGTVAYDEKLLALAAPTAAPTAARPNPQVPLVQIPQRQPGLQPGQVPQRQPRPRVVPPPTPGAQPQPQAQPTQINQRPDRRGVR